jgi:hypothetical protein
MTVLLSSDQDSLLYGKMMRILCAEFAVTPLTASEPDRAADTSARCVVLVNTRGSLDAAPFLADLRRTRPTLPTLLVTPRAEDVTTPAEAADAVVWIDAAETELRDQVHRARAARVRRRVSLAVRARTSMPSLQRRTLLELASAPEPFRTVGQLCETLACSRATLWRAWRVNRTDDAARLQDLIDWFVLLEAVSRKHGASTWVDVATSLLVHTHTLDRRARRLVGCTLGEVARRPDVVLADAAVDRMLARFLGDAPAERRALPA